MRAEKHCKQWISQYLFIDCASSQGVAGCIPSQYALLLAIRPKRQQNFQALSRPTQRPEIHSEDNADQTIPNLLSADLQWSLHVFAAVNRIWGPNFLAFSRLYRSRWNSSQGWSHTSRSLKISHWGHWLKGNSIEMVLIPACYNTSRSQRFRQFQSWSRRRHSPSKCIVVRPSFKRQLKISRISESLQYMIKQLSWSSSETPEHREW